MASKNKKTTSETSATKVTRISASDTKMPTTAKKDVSRKENEPVGDEKAKRRSPLRATSDYFKGAWYELKQVRWPTRRATWGMTAALIGFTAFFVAFILLLDGLFQYSFDLMIG